MPTMHGGNLKFLKNSAIWNSTQKTKFLGINLFKNLQDLLAKK